MTLQEEARELANGIFAVSEKCAQALWALADALDAAEAHAFELAANQCDGPKIGDDHGHFYCAKLAAAGAELDQMVGQAKDWRARAEAAEKRRKLERDEADALIAELGSARAAAEAENKRLLALMEKQAEEVIAEMEAATKHVEAAEAENKRLLATLDTIRRHSDKGSDAYDLACEAIQWDG